MKEAKKGKTLPVFDPHVHGGGGHPFATSKVEKILAAYRAQKGAGTTHLLATLICLPPSRTRRILKAVREAMKVESGILGAYIEGPFINPQKAGGMDPSAIGAWSLEEFKGVIEDFSDVIRLVVVAPEMDPEGKVAEILKANGVKIAVGHTTASYEECIDYCKKHRVLVFTHLFNAMGGFHHRSPGPAAAALLSDAYCEIIPEPHHLHPATIELAFRIKGERIIPVSDGTPLSASRLEEASFGDQKVVRKDGACFTEDGRLFGSAITLSKGMEYLEELLGISRDELIRRNAAYLEELLG